MDADGYPEDTVLKEIENFDMMKQPMTDLINKITSNWKYDGYKTYKYKGHLKLELHTCGWSGNEDIICALKRTKFPSLMMFHVKWECGGYYWFEIPIDFIKQKPHKI